MLKNLGTADRIARIAAGALFVWIGAMQSDERIRMLFGLLGLAGLLTGILGHDAVYSLLGWNTAGTAVAVKRERKKGARRR